MPETSLRSPAGVLRARHDPPQAPAPRGGPVGALVCHPHPLHGGTMDNKVVFAVAKCLRERGLHVLRFNFRGAGGSEGEHDEGRGEVEDARAALDALAELAGAEGRRGALLVAGFSFGSYVGLSAALHDRRVRALLAIAPPVPRYDYSAIAATDQPLTILAAQDDELVPIAAVRAFAEGCRVPPRLIEAPGAGHLFHGRLDAVRAAAEAWVDAACRDAAP